MAITRAEAAHFCRRVGYGGTAAELDFFTGMERSAAVDYVLGVPVNPVPTPSWIDDGTDGWIARESTTDWWLQRMADSRWTNRDASTPSPLVEKLSFFWHGHFATSEDKVDDMPKMYEQFVLFHDHGLGDFEYLCQQIAVGGAMLVYLDNATNYAEEPQENFARELMELFTMGVGNYTEGDVVSMARAWSGHNTIGWVEALNIQVNDYVFNDYLHDYGTKTLFGIAKNWDGPETITEIVRGSKQQVTARFIARKMFSHFAHANPSDAIVNALANTFIGANMNVAALLRAILNHSAFWGAPSRHQLVKPPVDFVAEMVKRVGMPLASTGIEWSLSFTGQMPFRPPNVSGWGENGYWLSTATAWGRQDLAQWGQWRSYDLELPLFAPFHDDPNLSPDVAAQMVFDAFGIVEASQSSRTGLRDWFIQARTEDLYGVQSEAVLMAATLPEFHVS